MSSAATLVLYRYHLADAFRIICVGRMFKRVFQPVTQRQNAGRITGISWARDGYEYLLYSMQPEMNMVVGLAVEFVTNTRAEPVV